jgi:hypothetical protein
MVAEAERTQVFAAPWQLVPEVLDHFRSDGDVLRELSRQWWSAFAGAVYVALEAGDGDLVADVSRAYAEVRHRHEALRRILEAHADHPAIAAAMAKERRLLRGALGGRLEPAPATLTPLDSAA